VHDTLNAYGLSDGSTDLYSGLVFVVQKTADEGWSVGQTLKVTGSHLEFYCMTELSATSVELIEATPTEVGPVPVDDFADNGEAYEGMVITVANATVTSIEGAESYGEIETDGGFIIDDWITGKEVLATPEVGAQYCSVTGLATYSFGAFRINPRSAADLVLCD
jgi:predicted extracellular nuclease